MWAAAVWVRSEWRRRLGGIAALVLLVGMAGGVTLLAASGARRTASSVERMTANARSSDVLVNIGDAEPSDWAAIAHLPNVRRTSAVTLVYAIVDSVEADLGILAPRDGDAGVGIERNRLLRGRHPDPTRVDELLVNESAARLLGLDVGDAVTIATLSPQQVLDEDYVPPRGPKFRFHVVGVERGPDDLRGDVSAGFTASPAFLRSVRGRVDEFETYVAVDLVDGAKVDDFEAALRRLPGGANLGTLTLRQRLNSSTGTVSSLAAGLTVFALIAGGAALVTVGQAIARHVAGGQTDAAVLTAVGMTARERRWATVLAVMPVAIGGGVLAAALSVAASPFMPIGLARRAEPSPGVAVDWPVLVSGAFALFVVVVVSAVVSAHWFDRRARPGARKDPVAFARVSARLGVTPATAVGAGLALDHRSGTVPVRSGLAGVALAVTGVVAVLTFSASLDRLVVAPQRWGYDWDVLLDFTSTTIDDATQRVGRDPGLSAVARWDTGYSHIEGSPVTAFGLTRVSGQIGFTLRSGRQPSGPGEVVLGVKSAERLGLGIGDVVRVGARSGRGSPVRVVGMALFPELDEKTFDDAIGLDGDGFAEHAVVTDQFNAYQLVVRVAPGRSVAATVSRLNRTFPGSASSGENLPVPPRSVADLSSLRSLPGWLAGFVAFLGVTSLGHVLLTTLRRRRGELATLRSIGFTRAQTAWCIVSQALVLTVAAVMIGTPLGLAAGGTAWRVITGPIGVATDPRRPVLPAMLVGLVAVVVAIGIAAFPGWRASRSSPASTLRVE